MSKCNNCKKEATPGEEICSVCNYPIEGSTKEQAVFIANQVTLKSQVKEAAEGIKVVRIALFVIAGYFVVTSFLVLFFTNDYADLMDFAFDLILNFVVAGVFTVFAFMTYKRPKIATLVPLILVLSYYSLLFFMNSPYLARGILWKGFLLLILSFGYFRVARSNAILKKHSYIASLLGYSRINEKSESPLDKSSKTDTVLLDDLSD